MLRTLGLTSSAKSTLSSPPGNLDCPRRGAYAICNQSCACSALMMGLLGCCWARSGLSDARSRCLYRSDSTVLSFAFCTRLRHMRPRTSSATSSYQLQSSSSCEKMIGLMCLAAERL